MNRKITKENIINYKGNRERFVKTKDPDLYEYISNQFSGKNFLEKLYKYAYNLKTTPKCQACGEPVNFVNFYHGYSQYCSRNCFSKNAWYSKFVESNIKRLGVEHHFQLKEYRDKFKQTNLERYGVEYAMQSDELKKRFIESCHDKYGVDWYTQSDEFKEKSKETNLKKRGVEFPMQLKEIRDQVNRTNIERYGGTGFASKELLEKSQKTFFNKTDQDWGCLTKTSIENFVEAILSENNIDFIKNDRDILSGKEIDFYIPFKKIAIECNGCFWHSSGGIISTTKYESNIKPYDYHIKKYKECQDKGIQLISLWEDWIKNNPEIVKSLLLSKLGIYDKKIYARKCVINEITSKDCSNFLDKNHIQGKTKTSIRLGAYFNDELVGVMTFSKHSKLSGNKKDNEEWVLSRFCTKLNTQVIGLADKLFKFFIKKYNPIYIVSFSSNDISDGKLYNKLGFTTDHKISNSYWYIKTNTFIRYHRSTFSKSRLKNIGFDITNKTEFEIMDTLPFFRIYDSGHIKWIYKIF